jgi:hypothetical protein
VSGGVAVSAALRLLAELLRRVPVSLLVLLAQQIFTRLRKRPVDGNVELPGTPDEAGTRLDRRGEGRL